MGQAFSEASVVISNWLSQHPDCYPPIVLNISDGEPDSDPSKEADEVKVSTLSLHVDLEGSQFVWLGSADDAESITLLNSIFAGAH